ncbi:MAG: DUF4065 domain-containing protein [Bacteroidota bacterium]|nr:DUF4065 domain-containing protein [Bacteroidota bacterium]
MPKEITSTVTGARIAQLRKQKGYSQQDIARFLEIPRTSVTQMELGKRNISLKELSKLSEVLGFSIDQLLSEDFEVEFKAETETHKSSPKQERISIPKMQTGKFKNILLYILERSAGKPNVGETVLYKLLYFSDFNYYEIYEEHLSGARYKKLPYGPVPQRLDSILRQMTEKGQVQRIKTEYHGFPQTRYIPLRKADLRKMSAAEKDVIDKVLERFSDWSAKKISEYSHNDKPWRASRDNEYIDYELVFYREPPYSVREYEEDE